MNKLNLLFCFLLSSVLFSQKDSLQISNTYLEDQLYIDITYTTLSNQPSNVSSSGFSYGFSGGFIKDIPLNQQRNFGLGIGLGYGFNLFNHGLKISENNHQITYEIDSTLTSNKFQFHSIEVPIEIRWRNSTATKYSFWRVYSGVKLSYNFANKFEYTDTTHTITLNNVSSLRKWQVGLTVSAGYDAFNIYFYYGLTPIFKNASINTQTIDTTIIKFGLSFYIL